MKKLLLVPVSLFLTLSLLAQKNPAESEVSPDDLKLTSCPFESEAVAMKLLDITESDFEIQYSGTRLKTERKVRIKLFNEKGFKYATVHIPFLDKRGKGKIKSLEGTVYSLDAAGKIKKTGLSEDDFFRQKIVDNIGMVSFTFPNLHAGCIVEFSYTTIEKDMINLNPWFIQDEIPVRYTANTITTPAAVKIYERVSGLDTISQSSYFIKYDQFRKTIYEQQDIPSFKAEPFMSSVNDHLRKVDFFMMPGGGAGLLRNMFSKPEVIWRMAGHELVNSGYFKDQEGQIIPGTEKIIDTAKTISPLKDRIAYIYSEVKKRIPQKVAQTIRFDKLDEVWQEKSGTSAEINFILLNLLEKTDVKCIPLLISTRENGRVNKTFPSPGQMNGIDVVAFDSTTSYILDASLKYQPFQIPPMNILNREAFLLNKDSMQWIMVSDNRALFHESIFTSADLNNEGTLAGSTNFQFYDYAKAIELDTTLAKNRKEKDEGYDRKPAGFKILSTTKTDPDRDEDPLLETTDFEYTLNNSGDFYFLNPGILYEKNKNPFLKDTRNTDIDFGCNQLYVSNTEVRIPPSFSVEHLPENLVVKAPDSSFYFKIFYYESGGTIYISEIFESKRAIFEKEEYAGVQEFFKKMYALRAEEIILKKKH